LRISSQYSKLFFAQEILSVIFIIMRCNLTGKGTASGNNVSHSKRRTKRTFKANIQTKRITLPNGNRIKAYLSTVVIKTFGKNDRKISKLIEKLGIEVK